MKYPTSISNLINIFSKLPGLGPKSAERLVFYLLKQPPDKLEELTQLIANLQKDIKICRTCFNVSTKDPCDICSDTKRDHSIICVVTTPQDLVVIEKTGEYYGLYHVLGENLNPLEGITPEKINIKELLERIRNPRSSSQKPVQEVIIATNPDLEGESTALYLTRQLKPLKAKITRLAKGLRLPVGRQGRQGSEARHTLKE